MANPEAFFPFTASQRRRSLCHRSVRRGKKAAFLRKQRAENAKKTCGICVGFGWASVLVSPIPFRAKQRRLISLGITGPVFKQGPCSFPCNKDRRVDVRKVHSSRLFRKRVSAPIRRGADRTTGQEELVWSRADKMPFVSSCCRYSRKGTFLGSSVNGLTSAAGT